MCIHFFFYRRLDGNACTAKSLIAFDPAQDVAVACLVVNAGYGAQYAGPEVKAFLSKF